MSVKGNKGKGGGGGGKEEVVTRPPPAKGAIAASLVVLDGLDVDALVLLIGEDERPLTGAAGLLDWRMCGWLSQQLLAGAFRGTRGEKVLTWPAGRLAVPAVVLMGLGKTAEAKDVLGATLDEVQKVLEGARLARVALGACVPAATVEEALSTRPQLKERIKTLLEAQAP